MTTESNSHRRFGVIWAQSINRIMGDSMTNRLPWHNPDDLKHFKTITDGGTLIMGRRTWQSMPPRLPGRDYIVVTSWLAHGAPHARTLDKALEMADPERPIWVIGGADLIEEALRHPLCQHLSVTYLEERAQGDRIAPTIPPRWSTRERRQINGGVIVTYDSLKPIGAPA